MNHKYFLNSEPHWRHSPKFVRNSLNIMKKISFKECCMEITIPNSLPTINCLKDHMTLFNITFLLAIQNNLLIRNSIHIINKISLREYVMEIKTWSRSRRNKKAMYKIIGLKFIDIANLVNFVFVWRCPYPMIRWWRFDYSRTFA